VRECKSKHYNAVYVKDALANSYQDTLPTDFNSVFEKYSLAAGYVTFYKYGSMKTGLNCQYIMNKSTANINTSLNPVYNFQEYYNSNKI